MEDIKDSEIRFIGKDETYDKNTVPVSSSTEDSKDNTVRNNDLVRHQKNMDREEGRYNKLKDGWSIRKILILFVLFVIVANVIFYIFKFCVYESPYDENIDGVEELENAMFDPEVPEGRFESQANVNNVSVVDSTIFMPASSSTSYCQVKEIGINGIDLKIMIPLDAVPKFEVGRINQNDPNIILSLQAADIRKDNGEIVGACVYNGEVVGKGLAKKGYVSIINGKMRIGVTDHSPLFEAAIQEGGDFFRQYPLVADGIMIENQPKGKAIRRAICQRGDTYFVAETLTPESFHDFAQALQDLRIDNAVYLVGSQYALGFLRDENNELHTWGETKFSKAKNISYLLWRKM